MSSSVLTQLVERAQLANERMRVALGGTGHQPNPPLGEDILNAVAAEAADSVEAAQTAAEVAGVSPEELTSMFDEIQTQRFMARIGGLIGYAGEEEFLGQVYLQQLTPAQQDAAIRQWTEQRGQQLASEGGKRTSRYKRKNRKTKSRRKNRKSKSRRRR